jgi:hypothetical protein
MGRSVSFKEAGGAGDSGVPDIAPSVSHSLWYQFWYQWMTVPGGNADVFDYGLEGPVGSQRVGSISFKVFRDGGGDGDFSALRMSFNIKVNGTLSGMDSFNECYKEDVETRTRRLAVSVGQVKGGRDRIVSERTAEENSGQIGLEYPWF